VVEVVLVEVVLSAGAVTAGAALTGGVTAGTVVGASVVVSGTDVLDAVVDGVSSAPATPSWEATHRATMVTKREVRRCTSANDTGFSRLPTSTQYPQPYE
jgi:hypothetical protein